MFFWSFLPFYHLNIHHFTTNSVTYSMVFISKRMQLSWAKNQSWKNIHSVLNQHTFIKAQHPGWNKNFSDSIPWSFASYPSRMHLYTPEELHWCSAGIVFLSFRHVGFLSHQVLMRTKNNHLTTQNKWISLTRCQWSKDNTLLQMVASCAPWVPEKCFPLITSSKSYMVSCSRHWLDQQGLMLLCNQFHQSPSFGHQPNIRMRLVHV